MYRVPVGATRGFRWGFLSLLTIAAMLAATVDDADARGKRKRGYAKRPAAVAQSTSPKHASIVVDAKTGQRASQQRIDGIFSASPVAGDGKIYFVSETGETIVLQAGRNPTVLARNDVGERAIASPAISNGQIFIRTDDHVFAIGTPAPRSR